MTEQNYIDMVTGVLTNINQPLTHELFESIETILSMNLRMMNGESGEKYMFLSHYTTPNAYDFDGFDDLLIDLYNYGRAVASFSLAEIRASITKSIDWKIYGF